MKRLGRAIEQVLYIVWRDWRDWYAFAWFLVFVAAVFGLGAAIWITVARYTAHDWHVFGVYVLSEFLLFLPFTSGKTKKIRDLDGEVLVWAIDAITRHGYILDLRERMLGDALGAALWGGGLGAGLLIGAVVVLRIVHWRNSRQRRRGTGERRAASVPRRRIGLSFHRILRLLRASVRFVWKIAKGYAHSGGVERGDTSSIVGKHHAAVGAAEGAADGPARRRRIPAVPAAFGKLTVRLFKSVRSVRRHRGDAAEVPQGQAPLQCDQRPGNKACDNPSGPRLPATSPAAPTASTPALLDDSAPRRSEPTSRMPHRQRQVSRDVRKSEGGGGASPKPHPSREPLGAARDNGSEVGLSTASQGERAASDSRMPGSSNPRPPAGTRLGARRKRRRASQDFY